MTAKEIYQLFVGNRLKPLVIEFDPYSEKYKYYPYHHINEDSFEETFANLMFDNIVFYAFEKNEIENEYNRQRLKNVHNAAVAAYNKNTFPKTERLNDGLLGELTLDCFLKTFFSETEMLYSRVKKIETVPRINLDIKRNGQEIKGYDGLVFSEQNGRKYMWTGQVKTGSWEYCLEAIKQDIDKSILKTYFADSMLIMADYLRAVSDNSASLNQIVNDINDLQFEYSQNESILHTKIVDYFKKNDITIRIPCLIMAEEDKYLNDTELLNIIKSKCSNAFNEFQINNQEGLNIEVIFLVFPIRNLKKLREYFLDIRKGSSK